MTTALTGIHPPSLPAAKADFIGLEGRVHLATGGEPPLLKVHRQAFERFAEDKANGFSGYHAHWALAENVRSQVARLVGLAAGDVALLGNASEGIERVVSSIDWRPGDNVVVPELDYASGRYALANLKQRGVDVRLVGHDPDGDRQGRRSRQVAPAKRIAADISGRRNGQFFTCRRIIDT